MVMTLAMINKMIPEDGC